MAGMASAERIGIDHLTLGGVAPPDLVSTAAKAGARNVSLHLRNNTNPLKLPHFSLIDDTAMRQETLRRARDLGVSIAMAEGFVIFPDKSVDEYRQALEVTAELGCTRINCLSFEPDWGRTRDEVTALAEIAGEYGQTVLLEFVRRYSIASAVKALEIIEHAGRPNIQILVDTLHLARSGEAESFKAIDPKHIGYVQICDGKAHEPDDEAYQKEAIANRQIPGRGELPLVSILRHVPIDVVVSGEVPMVARRQADVPDQQIADEVVAAIHKVLEAAASIDPSAPAPPR